MANNTVVIDVVPRLLGDKLGGQVLSMASKTSKAIAAPMNAAVNAAGLSVLAGLAVALTAGSRAAIQFEDAFAMVKKTMADVKDPEVFDEIAKDLQSLATTIPITANELAAIASVAGQLGVAAQDVAVFTEVTAKLGVATNMTSTQAATGLARFLNVTGETTDTVGKFGSVLVQLGNNVAAQESEILLLAQNFGATGNVAGLSAEDILAFSAATRAAGVQAAAGATALGKLFMNVSNAVKEGDFDKLSVASRLIGRDFKTAFEQDGALAVQELLAGLSALAASGESVTPVLSTLGLNNVRTSRAVLALANNNRGLAEAIALARQEAAVSNALNAEVETRMDTVSSKVQQLKTSFNALLIPLGEVFIPVFKAILDVAINIVNGFLGLQRVFGELQAAVKGVIGVLAGATGLSTIMDILNKGLQGVGKQGSFVRKVFTFLQGVFAKLGPIMKKALLPITTILLALNELGKREREIRDFEKGVESMGNTLEELDPDGASFADNFTEEIFEGIANGLPKAMQEGVQAGIEAGSLTEQGIEVSKQIADGLNSSLVEDLRSLADVGGLLFDSVNIDELLEGLAADGLSENSELVTLVEKINTEKKKGTRESAEEVELLQEQLKFHLLIIEAERNKLSFIETLRTLVEEELKDQGRIAELKEVQKAGDLRLIDTAKTLRFENAEILSLLEQQGIVQKANMELSPMQKMMEDAVKLRQMVDDIFLGAELDFATKFADMDLQEAREEELELIQEELDLREEEVELAQELVDLEKEQVETAEELAEQQELINEALEIEERIRNGFALSANDQLRREKLRKDRRRVELAAQQGSLEFADLELAAIDENIEKLEDKALTQEDADKLRAQSLEISEKAQARRQKEIEDIEKRRVAIGERLKELPREQLEAAEDILNSQKNILLVQLDQIEAMERLGTVSVQTAQKLAQSLKLPPSALSALSSGALASQPAVSNIQNQTGINLGANMTTAGQASSAYMNANRLLNPIQTNNSGKASSSYNNPYSNMNQYHLNVTNNMSGIPPSSQGASKFAKQIQRELEKLEQGRSGIIR